MRTAIVLVTLATALIGVAGLSAGPASGCHDMEKTAKKYFVENFGADEEKPVRINHKTIRLTAAVSAVQFTAPEDTEDPEAKHTVFTSFFGGQGQCEFLFQSDGEIAEILDAGETKYVFVRHDSDEGDQRHIDDQVLTVTADGEVQPTRDQHGSEIFFSQTVQKRCEGKVGEATLWSRDADDSRRITVRHRHTARDARCRVIEDSSSYRYYRLTAKVWHLDEPEEEIVTSLTDAAPAVAKKQRRD